MISVVMTVYNVADYIKEAIDSILNQSYNDLELIIVNDCTKDNSMDIVNSYNDNRIKVINHKENLGAGMARRTGIKHATGDYIITIDADDYISKDFLLDLYNKAIETDADITGGGMTVFNSTEQKVTEYPEKISEGMQKFLDYNDGKVIFLNNKLIKSSLYDLVTYSGRRFCEDTPTVIPLMYYANKIAYSKNSGYFYRMREESITHSLSPLIDNLYKALCAKDCIEFFKDKELEYRNIIPISQFLFHVNKLKELNLSYRDILPYKDLFSELMIYVLNILTFK